MKEDRQTNIQMYRKPTNQTFCASYSTYRHTDRQTDRLTERQNNQAQKDKQTDRQINRQYMCDVQEDSGQNMKKYHCEY